MWVCSCALMRLVCVSSSPKTMGFEIMLFRLGDVVVRRERREGLKKRLKRVLSLAMVFDVSNGFLDKMYIRGRERAKCASRGKLQCWTVFKTSSAPATSIFLILPSPCSAVL